MAFFDTARVHALFNTAQTCHVRKAAMAVKLRGVDPDELSEAVVVWTGKREHASPCRDEARVVAAYGEERALDLLPRIKALEEEFYESDARVTAPDLREMGERAAADFHERHPELSEEAVDALAWCYTFDFK